MIVIALALLAEAASPTATPRKSLSDCLNNLVQPAANGHVKPEEFVTQTKEKCSAQQAALQQFLVQQNRTDGMKPAEADNDAKEQVQELFDRVQGKYKDWYENPPKGS